MILGGWNINAVTGGMPQKVATAFSEVFDGLTGAEYTPIAYLGEQVANGTNHAILAEQTLVLGRDIHNIVLIVLNERNEKFSIERIENVVAGGAPLGGIKIDVSTEIKGEAEKAWNEAFQMFVGSAVKPFALLGTQVTNGTDYIFAATSKMITRPVGDGVGVKFTDKEEVVIVTVHTATNHAEFKAVLSGSTSGNGTSVGAPLGEYP